MNDQQTALDTAAALLSLATFPPNTPPPTIPPPPQAGAPNFWADFWAWVAQAVDIVRRANAPVLPQPPVNPAP